MGSPKKFQSTGAHNSSGKKQWLRYFIENGLDYGYMHAWAKAAAVAPDIIFNLGTTRGDDGGSDCELIPAFKADRLSIVEPQVFVTMGPKTLHASGDGMVVTYSEWAWEGINRKRVEWRKTEFREDSGLRTLQETAQAQRMWIGRLADTEAGSPWAKQCTVQRQQFTNPVDEAAALFFLLTSPERWESASPAWGRLIHNIASLDSVIGDLDSVIGDILFELLCLFPYCSTDHWFPSWDQVGEFLDIRIREDQHPDKLDPPVDNSPHLCKGFIYQGYQLKKEEKRGLEHYLWREEERIGKALTNAGAHALLGLLWELYNLYTLE
ncbi:hypothetical protein BDZ91DRAFT_764697 [Kalaharituber pfeilii]|nr:hypothetical protein BDZ91DRAFT_764697 [Kalaharituber pfeilii]